MTPFDDRANPDCRTDGLSPALIRQFLHESKNQLLDAQPPVSDDDLYNQLRLVKPVNGQKVPRNVAILFFHHTPEQFFPGARIKVASFPDDAGGDLLVERVFRGPLIDQIQAALNYVRGFCPEIVQKVDGRAEANRFFAYPPEAIEEALVNAVYHRGYDGPSEPTKVYIYPRRIEITSYPGPVAGVNLDQLRPGGPVPTAPARNRRIGEFLKEVKLAEARNTGIPKIHRKLAGNGSPPVVFDFDDDRTYYRATFAIHPDTPRI